MKISKKDLRRIIIENVLGTRTLKEGVNLNSAWRAASNFREAPEDEAARAELVRFKEKLEQHEKVSDGPFRKGKGRATEAKALLDNIIKLLEANPESVGSVSLPSEIPENQKADDVTDAVAGEQGGEDTGDWKAYEGEKDWLYKIKGDTPNQIWVTKKAAGGPEYQLNKPKYSVTVKKLDGSEKLPDRTDASKAKDPALKTPSAKTSSAEQASKAAAAPSQENLTHSFERSNADWRIKTLSTYPEMPLPEISDDDTFDLGENSETTRGTALQKIIDWFYEADVITGFGGDLSDVPDAERYNSSKALSITGDNWKDEAEKVYTDHIAGGEGGKRSGLLNTPVKRITYATIEALARINNAYNFSLNMKAKSGTNESKVIYGKSHATLLRERYWGRY